MMSSIHLKFSTFFLDVLCFVWHLSILDLVSFSVFYRCNNIWLIKIYFYYLYIIFIKKFVLSCLFVYKWLISSSQKQLVQKSHSFISEERHVQTVVNMHEKTKYESLYLLILQLSCQ